MAEYKVDIQLPARAVVAILLFAAGYFLVVHVTQQSEEPPYTF